MPPAILELLQRPQARIALIAILVVVVVGGGILGLWLSSSGGGGGGSGEAAGSVKLKEDERSIATVESIGKAIEIQALLAREGIRAERKAGDGGKSELSLAVGSSLADRDQALITLVQSGLMDKNIGLEAFEKGDLTASREEKQIKLFRAQQGELARLIRKIPPIEDASVKLSIPEQSIFKKQQKPMSASIQVSLPVGTSLNRDKVRSIINLVVGSVQGLDAQHVSLSDTEGTVYHSVLGGSDGFQDKLEEQDLYMKQKISSQLDSLVGPGHYVVTVSTLLREATRETMVQSYDPQKSAVSSKQTFTERLNSAASGKGGSAGGPTSTNVPPELTALMNHTGSEQTSSNSRGYVRDGEEVSYDNTKTQWVETDFPGMIEDISVAVTIDEDHYPNTLNQNSLQQLIAHAASPKVNPSNVSVAVINFKKPDVITQSVSVPQKEDNFLTGLGWLPWAIASGVIILLFMTYLAGNRPPKQDNRLIEETRHELQQLREIANQQQFQIQAAQQQAQQLMASQQQQQQLLASVASTPQQMPQQAIPQQSGVSAGEGQAENVREKLEQAKHLRQTLTELQDIVQEDELDDEALDSQITSWIESS